MPPGLPPELETRKPSAAVVPVSVSSWSYRTQLGKGRVNSRPSAAPPIYVLYAERWRPKESALPVVVAEMATV